MLWSTSTGGRFNDALSNHDLGQPICLGVIICDVLDCVPPTTLIELDTARCEIADGQYYPMDDDGV